MGFIRCTVSLDKFSCDMAHGAVSAAFADFFRTGIKVCELIIVNKISHIACSVIYFNIRRIGAVKETSLTQGIRIKIREELLDAFLQFRIGFSIRHGRYREIHMELWSRCLAVFHFHVVAAIADK